MLSASACYFSGFEVTTRWCYPPLSAPQSPEVSYQTEYLQQPIFNCRASLSHLSSFLLLVIPSDVLNEGSCDLNLPSLLHRTYLDPVLAIPSFTPCLVCSYSFESTDQHGLWSFRPHLTQHPCSTLNWHQSSTRASRQATASYYSK